MKKIIVLFVLLIISITIQAQFFHSIELNNGIAINGMSENNYYTGGNPSGRIYFTGLSSAINVKYLNHNYWNLSSQLGYLEVGQKTVQDVIDHTTNNMIKSYSVSYFNMLSFNSMLEIKYPNKYITPSVKFGLRIDYTYVDVPVYDYLNKFNYGYSLGGGLNYQFKGHFNLHADYIYNWYAKDILKAHDFDIGASHTFTIPAVSIERSMSIMVGFGYKF